MSVSLPQDRFKLLFTRINVSLTSFCQDNDLPYFYLEAVYNHQAPLTTTMAQRVAVACQVYGLGVTAEWLLEGTGEPRASFGSNAPLKTSIDQEVKDIQITLDQELVIVKEVEFFRYTNENAIIFHVPDNAMFPTYKQGCWIGGHQRSGEDVFHLIGQDCIIVLTDGSTYARRLTYHAIEKKFLLIAFNPHETAEPIIRVDVIQSAAAIVWIRHPNMTV